MKKTILLLCFCLALLPAIAQKKWQPTGAVRIGLLEGEAGGSPLLEVSAGLRRKTWTASIGSGLDYYEQRSIPLFLQVQKAFGAAAKAPFVYAGGGGHFPWLTADQKRGDGWEPKGGFYGDAGVGYSLPVAKTAALQFSLGYSVKTMTVREDFVTIPIWPPPGPSFSEERHVYRRLNLKMGLRF